MRNEKLRMYLGMATAVIMMAGFVYVQKALADDTKPDYTSKAPRFKFAKTLEEQEAQLKNNWLLKRFRESRKKKAEDPHRPIYHYYNPEGRLGDLNGLCFWQGRWHLFYQSGPLEDPRAHWGHAVSEDLIHWRDLPHAIYPGPEKYSFSGSTLVEKDRVIALYHGVEAGTMVAVSSDPLLLNWKKVTGQAVIPFPKPGEPPVPYNIHDGCIWKKDGVYYALTDGQLKEGPGGKLVRAEFLHRSKDLEHWEYLHPFLENDRYGLIGDDGPCPYFWPIGDRHILLHFSHMSGSKYVIGDYDKERDKLVVTDGGAFCFGPCSPAGVHAPSVTPDGKGGLIVAFRMSRGKGLIACATLPRRLTLAADDPLTNLYIEPAAKVESLRYDRRHIDTMTLPANQEIVLDDVRGNSMEIVAEIDPKNSAMVELDVLRSPNKEEFTRIMFFKKRGYRYQEFRDTGHSGKHRSVICIDMSYSSTLPDVRIRMPEMAMLYIPPDEPLKLRVFIDRSIVEVYVNGKQCVAVMVYPGREDSIGVSLRAQGQDAILTYLDAWQMENIYE